MKITKLGLRNYRTLEAVDLEFPRDYTAICGRNDSGKTNVVRAIRCLMKEDDPYSYHMTEGPEFKVGDDFTKWSSLEDTNRHIGVTAQFTIDSGTDTGLHEFLVTYLSIDEAPTELILDVDMQHAAEQQASGEHPDRNRVHIRHQSARNPQETPDFNHLPIPQSHGGRPSICSIRPRSATRDSWGTSGETREGAEAGREPASTTRTGPAGGGSRVTWSTQRKIQGRSVLPEIRPQLFSLEAV